MNSSYSVVIPAYNAAEWLEQTAESVLGQTLPPERVVIVDDGSGDETWKLCQQLSERYPQVLSIKQENQGPSVARNRGFEEIASDFVAFLDADDLWRPAFAQTAIERLESVEKDVFIAQARRFFETVGDIDEDYGPSKAYALSAPQSILSGIPFAPCMVMLRAAAYRQIGGFRGGEVYWEDWDLWIRLAEGGAGFEFDLGKPLADYRRSPESRSSDALRCFRKSLATVEEHWQSPLAPARAKRRAKSRYLRWCGKSSIRFWRKAWYFWRALNEAPFYWKNWVVFVYLLDYPTKERL